MITQTLDIVLPIYNPHDGWEKSLLKYYEELYQELGNAYQLKMILVNDGSKKDIQNAIQSILSYYPQSIYISYPENMGKGFALRKGIDKTTSSFILFTDYDFPYKVESMLKMIYTFRKDQLDIAIAKRNQSYYQNIQSSRSYISRLLKKVNQFLLRLPVNDTQGGLKMFTHEVKSTFLETKTNRYLIDIDFLKRAHQKKYGITPIEVELREDLALTQISNMHIGKELWNYIKLIFS